MEPLREVASDLALAIVTASIAPLVLLDGQLNIIATSGSFCQSFNIDPAKTKGRALSSLGGGEWNVPQLQSLLEATIGGNVSIPTYEMDLKRAGKPIQRLVLTPQKLAYGDTESARLLLAIADVTAFWNSEHEKSALIAEKAVLLREVQHRVANSLQIIASILLQSARRVQSDETRGYLTDAHSRVMSMAAVQQQLAITDAAEVELRSYFTQLCKSLGASMIRDHATQRIIVEADLCMASANQSISLGLIITELVINALKHAFPQESGTITVSYKQQAGSWMMCVRDDGIGMPKGVGAVTPGLGTSLVHALAQKMEADVVVSDAEPGTLVCVTHEGAV